MTWASCDVVIPTWKGERYLTSLVEALRRQTHQPQRIIVIDSSSPDGTVALAGQLGCQTEVIPQAEFNHGGTRNRAAWLGSADIIVFMTQDALPDNENFLANLCSVFAESQVDAAFARQVPYPDADPPEVFARSFNYSQVPERRTVAAIANRGVRAYFFSNVASAVRRSAFVELGGFPDQLPMNEDMVLCARLLARGSVVAYEPTAIVRHSHNYSLRQQASRYFDIGAFFADQGHLLPGGRTGGEGFRFAWGQWLWLICHGHLGWALRTPVELTCKWWSFQAGNRYHRLPFWLVERWAMHPGYFRMRRTQQMQEQHQERVV